MTRVVICCGAGGVGKTTLSAALALRLAWEGARVGALTIDPARRLADSLGVQAVGNVPTKIPLDGLEPRPSIAGPETRGKKANPNGLLEAMMLDAKATFDGLIQRVSPNTTTTNRIFENRYYRLASTRLAGSQEYMAMVRLLDLVEEQRYDFVILDTPPTRHALEFLSAPDRVSRVMDSRVIRVLTMGHTTSGLATLMERGSSVLKVLDRLLGIETIRELADFVSAFDGMTESFRERSLQAARLLRSPQCAFVLITSPRPSAAIEARQFQKVLRERNLPLWGFIVNRVEPPPPAGEIPVLEDLVLTGCEKVSPDDAIDIARGIQRAPEFFRSLAEMDAENVKALANSLERGTVLWTVPTLDEDIHTLDALLALGLYLPGARDFSNPDAA